VTLILYEHSYLINREAKKVIVITRQVYPDGKRRLTSMFFGETVRNKQHENFRGQGRRKRSER